MLSYGAERSGANRRPLTLALAVAGAVLGALMFAGSLASGGREAWPGLPAGILCAAVAVFVPPLSFLALAGFLLLLVRGRRDRDRKYAGLRVLR